MMKRLYEKKSLIIVIVLLIIFLAMAVYQVNFGTTENKPPKHVSMIVYGDDSERWENMYEGAYLVCKEQNAELSLLTMMSENDVNEQEEIIEREIEDGADALLIAPCDSSVIKHFIDQKELKIPVVYIETVESASFTDGVLWNELKYCAARSRPSGFRAGSMRTTASPSLFTMSSFCVAVK